MGSQVGAVGFCHPFVSVFPQPLLFEFPQPLLFEFPKVPADVFQLLLVSVGATLVVCGSVVGNSVFVVVTNGTSDSLGVGDDVV